MVIYSEILGKSFPTVEECLAAEEQYNKKLKEEELQRKKQQEKLEEVIHDGYENLVHAWTNYFKALTLAGYDVDGMEDKALIFVEVVLDAEDREAKNLKS